MLAVLLTESYGAKKHGLYEYHIQTVWVHSQTHHSAWDKIPLSAHMQNANIFLSATVPCYIAASLVIFIWILHLCFLPLSVCVIVSNTGRDLSPRSNRGRLPPPAARFWGLTLWDWSFYFCLVSEKRREVLGGGQDGKGGDWQGEGCFKRETPSVVPEVSICPQEGCNKHRLRALIDACARVLINIIIMRAWRHAHLRFFCFFLWLRGGDDRAGWHTGWQTGRSSETSPARGFVHFKVSLKPPWALS